MSNESVTRALKQPVARRTPAIDEPTNQPKSDNPGQYRPFVETARKVEADESPDAMDRAFERVVKPKKSADEPPKNGGRS